MPLGDGTLSPISIRMIAIDSRDLGHSAKSIESCITGINIDSERSNYGHRALLQWQEGSITLITLLLASRILLITRYKKRKHVNVSERLP